MKKARHSPFRYQLAHRLMLSVSLHCPPYPTVTQLKHIARVGLMPSVRQAWISLVITDKEQSRTLNKHWRGNNYPTNVLSFLLNESTSTGNMAMPLMGDLVLCAPIVAVEAQQQHKTLLAHYAHLIIHGMLHLQGYHHEDSAEASATMQQLEKTLLARLGFANPYSD